jgi:hypothetical protein
MNEMSPGKTPESEQPQGAVPQGVADDVAVLAGEIRAMERRADRGWKITAVVWVILLAVIAGYLYILIYKPLKETLQPETIVQLAVTQVNTILKSIDAPKLESAELPQWLAEKLKAEAPRLVNEELKPRLVQLKEDLPELRRDATKQLLAEAPDLIDRGIEALETDLLPAANDELIRMLGEKLDELADRIEQNLDSIVHEVIDQVEQDVGDLADTEKMRLAMEATFEEAMGPVLDEVLAGLDLKVEEVREKVAVLVESYKLGALSHDQMLEVRLIQLIRALFEQAAAKPAEVEGWVQTLMDQLGGLELPEEAQADIRRQVRRGGEIDLSHIPAEQRERVRQAIERARQAAKQVVGRPEEVPKTPEAAQQRAGRPGRPPEVIEKAEKKAEEAAPQAGRSGGPPPEIRAKMEAARKAAEEARKAAAEAE